MNGKKLFVEINTGEILDMYPGDSIRRNASDLAYKKKNQSRHNGAQFTFSTIEGVIEASHKLTNSQLGHLLHLQTFLGWNDEIIRKNKKPINKSGLRELMKVDRKTSYLFLSACKEAGIMFENENKEIGIYKKYHFKGAVNEPKGAMKNMSKAIRELHEDHKTTELGILYKLRGYLHITTNVLVKNPNETNEDYIEFLNKEELADLIGVSPDQLTKALGKLRYDGMLVVGQLKVGKEIKFVVNPLVFTRTASPKDETLRLIFKKTKKKGRK